VIIHFQWFRLRGKYYHRSESVYYLWKVVHISPDWYSYKYTIEIKLFTVFQWINWFWFKEYLYIFINVYVWTNVRIFWRLMITHSKIKYNFQIWIWQIQILILIFMLYVIFSSCCKIYWNFLLLFVRLHDAEGFVSQILRHIAIHN
jgi:hypothetical protein